MRRVILQHRGDIPSFIEHPLFENIVCSYGGGVRHPGDNNEGVKRHNRDELAGHEQQKKKLLAHGHTLGVSRKDSIISFSQTINPFTFLLFQPARHKPCSSGISVSVLGELTYTFIPFGTTI